MKSTRSFSLSLSLSWLQMILFSLHNLKIIPWPLLLTISLFFILNKFAHDAVRMNEYNEWVAMKRLGRQSNT